MSKVLCALTLAGALGGSAAAAPSFTVVNFQASADVSAAVLDQGFNSLYFDSQGTSFTTFPASADHTAAGSDPIGWGASAHAWGSAALTGTEYTVTAGGASSASLGGGAYISEGRAQFESSVTLALNEAAEVHFFFSGGRNASIQNQVQNQEAFVRLDQLSGDPSLSTSVFGYATNALAPSLDATVMLQPGTYRFIVQVVATSARDQDFFFDPASMNASASATFTARIIPAPGALGVLGALGLAAARRRRA